MYLSDRKIKKIRKIIEDHYNILQFIFTGDGTPDPQIAKQVGIPLNDVPMIEQAYILGKLVQTMKKDELSKLTIKQLKRKARMTNLTQQEKYALGYAKERAGQYMTALGQATDSKARMKIIERNKNHAIDYFEIQRKAKENEITVIQKKTMEAILDQKTKGWLKTELINEIGDVKRDWQRVAHTELWNAKLDGEVQTIKQAYPDSGQTRVFRRPRQDACKHCLKLHMKDGKPIVYTLDYLVSNGTNKGKKVSEWLPVAESVHPNCACTLHVIPDGYDFDDNGNMIFVGLGKESWRGHVVGEPKHLKAKIKNDDSKKKK